VTVELSTILRVVAEHDDYQTIMETASEYGERGYSRRGDGPVVLGNYWCQRSDCNYPERYEDGKRKIHSLDYHYPRVMNVLDSECELEWYDEWVVVDDRAYRIHADSYSWQPTAVYNSDSDSYLIAGEDIESWIEWATNDSTRCLMRDSFSVSELEEYGWVERECGFASGWHEGMNDNPVSISEAIRDEHPELDVMFKLSETSQFYVTFCVLTRAPDWDAANDGSEDE